METLQGAVKEFVYKSKLKLNEITRDIECIVQELADAKLEVPVDIRTNEVVGTQLTPVLKLWKKAANGLKGDEVVSVDKQPVQLNLGDKVRELIFFFLFFSFFLQKF